MINSDFDDVQTYAKSHIIFRSTFSSFLQERSTPYSTVSNICTVSNGNIV